MSPKKRKITIDIHEEYKNWNNGIAPFQKPNRRKSLWQLTNTIVPFLGVWCLAYLSLSVSIWITMALAILASGFFLRIFIIFHDCCHHSFFKSRRANEIVGIITGILTFFPYHQWKYEHSVHHATSGNLARRGTGDMWTMTVNEYTESSSLLRIFYRLYRNPFVMFGLGPLHLFLNQYRFNRKGAGRRERINTHVTTFTLAAILGLLCLILGWKGVLLVEGPILYLSGMVGIWLFYVQHQFEHTYFEKAENWDYVSAALQGSSFYKLPRVLQWMTGNIGFHHVHHLGPRVPNYSLQSAHENIQFLQNVRGVSLLSSLRSLRYRLWDEDNNRFVGFKEIEKGNLNYEKKFRVQAALLIRTLLKKSKIQH
ncbi:Delta(5) desaturase DesA [Alicyclobacillus mengziensis]|uniref:Fatty acid desaturase n=1 Tax=Alicyclobacillus mengziensis TaxID=2931921 RepID=A0A9X7W177_9BACL|nr:fatty acid desaturase [Alicyclobacillus mengziensis]QSO48831.1 fatty acid desaturase [Alicyclobacillus mengziensis]